jgi:preprotein translocase subunit SecA
VLLHVLDRKWREHLYEMDYLKEGIGLRAMGQRDPLVEYQREGFDLFTAMMDAIKEEAVSLLFRAQVETPPAVEAGTAAAGEGVGATVEALAQGLQPSRPAALNYSAPSVDAEGGVETRTEGGSAKSAPAEGGNRSARRAAGRAARRRKG